jgi:hypothetical protein
MSECNARRRNEAVRAGSRRIRRSKVRCLFGERSVDLRLPGWIGGDGAKYELDNRS